MLISWQARVLEMKCRFRGAGGVEVGGGAAPPRAAHQILIKQVLAAKMRLRSADTLNRLVALLLAWLVPVLLLLLLCCGSWRLRLWLLSLLLVLVAVVVGRSELEHELVHPPLRGQSFDPNSNSNWPTPGSNCCRPELELELVHPRPARCRSELELEPVHPPGSKYGCRSELELEPVQPPPAR